VRALRSPFRRRGTELRFRQGAGSMRGMLKTTDLESLSAPQLREVPRDLLGKVEALQSEVLF